MQNGLTLPKQNWQQPLLTFSSTCAHPTTLRKKGYLICFMKIGIMLGNGELAKVKAPFSYYLDRKTLLQTGGEFKAN